jgi:hypothetical protein
MNKFSLALATSLLALTACPPVEGGDSGDSGDEPVYEGPWQIDAFVWSCDTTSGAYTYSVEMAGWADSATLDIFETGNWDGSNEASVWDETHPLSQGEYAEDGSSDTWEIVLAAAVNGDGAPDAGEQTSGESTLWTCGTHGEAELAWKASADFGVNGDDCVVFGNEAADWFNTNQGGECFDLNG